MLAPTDRNGNTMLPLILSPSHARVATKSDVRTSLLTLSHPLTQPSHNAIDGLESRDCRADEKEIDRSQHVDA
jgi:hypothetical protein